MKTTAALTRTAAAQGARRKRFRKALPLMILSLPAVISIFVFCYMPISVCSTSSPGTPV